jgi:LmbE family N-acetylglucosaminyl deacetylase
MPTEYVDVTDTLETKKQMLLCHKSQMSYTEDLNSYDPTEIIYTGGRFRGFAAGCRYAEGFTRFDAWYRGLAYRILP